MFVLIALNALWAVDSVLLLFSGWVETTLLGECFVVGQALLTALVAEASGDPSLAERTWVLLTEAPEGGWGLAGHAHTNAELVQAARDEIARLQQG